MVTCPELKYQVTLTADYPGGPKDLVRDFCLSNNWVSLPDPIPQAELPERSTIYAFEGYYSKPGGAGVQYVDKYGKWVKPIPPDAPKLYAKWRAKKVVVKAGLRDATVSAELTDVVWHAPMPQLPQSLYDLALSSANMSYSGVFSQPQVKLTDPSSGTQYYGASGQSTCDWTDKAYDAKTVENPPTLYMHWISERARAVIRSVTTRAPWTGEVDIDYEGVDIPDNNAHAYRIELQYRISSDGEWTTVPAEDYRRPSDWTETVDGGLVHRITNGVDRLTWDARKTLGTDVNRRDSQVRINVRDLGARWDGYDADSPPGLWPAKLLDLDLAGGSIASVPDRPSNLDELKARAQAEMVYFYRSQHMLFREVPAGFFKRGDQYWHFGGTAYVGVFRMTGDQYTMITTSTKAGDLNLKQVSLENLRGTGASAGGEPLPTSPLGKLNTKIASSGWRIDVLPDYAYGQRLLWAGNETCPVTDVSTANEYGDFGSNPAAGGKRPSDWGFYDLVSGQEWTRSTNAGNYGPFGATSASDAKTQLNSDVNCNTPETTTRAVRLVLWRQETTLVTEKVFASDLEPRGSYLPGDPAWVWLDTRIERDIIAPTMLPYSGTHWREIAGKKAVISATLESDGKTEYVAYPGYQGFDGAGDGEVLWRPLCEGRYTLTHYVGSKAETCVYNVLKGGADIAYETLPLPWSRYLKADIWLKGLSTNGNYTLELQYRLTNDVWKTVPSGSLQGVPSVVSNMSLTAAWYAPDQLGEKFVGDVDVRSVLWEGPIADGKKGSAQVYPQDAIVLNLEDGTVTHDVVKDFGELWDRYLRDGKPATTNMVFVKVAAGSYFNHDGSLKIVDRDYYIAAAPVTLEQFEAASGIFPARGLIYPFAESFVADLKKKFSDFEFEVPTEDEWERAVDGELVHIDRQNWEWCSDFFDDSETDRVLRRSETERESGRPDRADASWRVRPILRLPNTPKQEYWSITGEVCRVSFDFTNLLSIANGETVPLALDGWGLTPDSTYTELHVAGGSRETFYSVVTNFDASVTGQVVRVRENGRYDLLANLGGEVFLVGEAFVRIPGAVISNAIDRTPWSPIKEFRYGVEGIGGSVTVKPVLRWCSQSNEDADWQTIDDGSLLAGGEIIEANGEYGFKIDPVALGIVPVNVETSIVFRVDLVDQADPTAVYRGEPFWCNIDTLEVHEGGLEISIPYSSEEWGDTPGGYPTALLTAGNLDLKPNLESYELEYSATNLVYDYIWQPEYNGLYELTLILVAQDGTRKTYTTKYNVSGYNDYVIDMVGHPWLRDAVAAAQAGQTITLKRDLPRYVGHTDIPAGQDVVLDFTDRKFNGSVTAAGKVRIDGGFFGGALVTDLSLTNEIVRGYFAQYPTNWYPAVGSALLLNQDAATQKDYRWRVYDATEIAAAGWAGAVGFGEDPDVRLDYRPAATPGELETMLGEKGAGGVQFFKDVTEGFTVPDVNLATTNVVKLYVLLNGHNLLGKRGKKPGEAGGVALTVGTGWDVAVLNWRSASDAKIVGGNGANGADGWFDGKQMQEATNGGDGAVAIDSDSRLAVQTEPTDGCRRISVQGGNGGNGGSSMLGNGGKGGNGACSIYGRGGNGGNGGNCYDWTDGGRGGDGGDGGAALLPGYSGKPGSAGNPNAQPGADPCVDFYWAARVDGVDKKSFTAAFNALQDGSLMVFYRDFHGCLPVMPNLGTVTFDLRGRSILGIDGTDARDPAKADGKYALYINMNTHLVLTNSMTNCVSYVKGGAGAPGVDGYESDGNIVPGGKGAVAVMPLTAIPDNWIEWDHASVVVTNGVDGTNGVSLVKTLNTTDYRYDFRRGALTVSNLVDSVLLTNGTDYVWSYTCGRYLTNVTVTVTGTNHYTGTVTVDFANLYDRGAFVFADGRGTYYDTLAALTSDVLSAADGIILFENLNGTLEIPDNPGVKRELVLNLNGHSITGATGKVSGEAGHSAISIGSGWFVKLVNTDLAHASNVIGGDGADGDEGYGGANGADGAPGAAEIVSRSAVELVEVGELVLRAGAGGDAGDAYSSGNGGVGGKGGDSLYGDGGKGGDGGDAYGTGKGGDGGKGGDSLAGTPGVGGNGGIPDGAAGADGRQGAGVYVASADNVFFVNLNDAFLSVTNGGDVVLWTNRLGTVHIPNVGRTETVFTLDLNGCEIAGEDGKTTGANGQAAMAVGIYAHLVVKDSSADKTGVIRGGNGADGSFFDADTMIAPGVGGPWMEGPAANVDISALAAGQVRDGNPGTDYRQPIAEPDVAVVYGRAAGSTAAHLSVSDTVHAVQMVSPRDYVAKVEVSDYGSNVTVTVTGTNHYTGTLVKAYDDFSAAARAVVWASGEPVFCDSAADVAAALAKPGAVGLTLYGDLNETLALGDNAQGGVKPIFINLNGHRVVGPNGATDGANGQSAITIGKGWDVKLVNTSATTAEVLGGNGADGADGTGGQPGGNGGAGAPEIVSRSQLTVVDADKITLRAGDGGMGGDGFGAGAGGAGGKGGDSLYGDGGKGGDGGDAFGTGKGGDGGKGGDSLTGTPGAGGTYGDGKPDGADGEPGKVGAGEYVVSVDGVFYKSMAEADGDARDGSELKLWADMSDTVRFADLDVVRKLTFDLNGHVIHGRDGKADGEAGTPAVEIAYNTTVRFVDTSAAQTGALIGGDGAQGEDSLDVTGVTRGGKGACWMEGRSVPTAETGWTSESCDVSAIAPDRVKNGKDGEDGKLIVKTLNTTDYSYDFRRGSLTVSNLVDSVLLTNGTDYVWSYTCGRYLTNVTVTVTGTNHYTGTVNVDFSNLYDRGAFVFADGRGTYYDTLAALTADVLSAADGLILFENLNGTLEIPDNPGVKRELVLNLNGHSITGATGKVSGEAGHSAISIGSGWFVKLVNTDLAHASNVIGGDGADGEEGYGGANGADGAPGAAEIVSRSAVELVEAGELVLRAGAGGDAGDAYSSGNGGVGGKGGDSLYGDGGKGGDGGDAYGTGKGGDGGKGGDSLTGTPGVGGQGGTPDGAAGADGKRGAGIYVAAADNVFFTDLDQALQSVTNGGDVVLWANRLGTVRIPNVGRTETVFTLDLNGCEIAGEDGKKTGESGQAALAVGIYAHLVVKDSSADKTGVIRGGNGADGSFFDAETMIAPGAGGPWMEGPAANVDISALAAGQVRNGNPGTDYRQQVVEPDVAVVYGRAAGSTAAHLSVSDTVHAVQMVLPRDYVAKVEVADYGSNVTVTVTGTNHYTGTLVKVYDDFSSAARAVVWASGEPVFCDSAADVAAALAKPGAVGLTLYDDLNETLALGDNAQGGIKSIFVNLNGHKVVGPNGATDGADGKSAITIGKGWDVKLVNTSATTAEVRGGNGADGADGTGGQPGGNGGAGAPEIVSRSQLTVVDADKITLRAGNGGMGGDGFGAGAGGAGGKGGDSLYGDGGKGGDGGDAFGTGKGGDGGKGGDSLTGTPGAGGTYGDGKPDGADGEPGKVGAGEYVVSVDGVFYKSMAEADGDARDGSELKLWADMSDTVRFADLDVVRKLTFDLNGHVIHGRDGKADGEAGTPAVEIAYNTTVKFVDSSAAQTGALVGGDGAQGEDTLDGSGVTRGGKGACWMEGRSVPTAETGWTSESCDVSAIAPDRVKNGKDGEDGVSLIALLRSRLEPEGTAELRNGVAFAYLTNDLVRSVEVPHKMGPVTFDLRGCVMTGEAGKPALSVREGTQLTVVDSDPARRGNVVAGAGAPCPYELASTNGLSKTELPYAASSFDGAGVRHFTYDAKPHSLWFVTAADEKVEFTSANEFVDVGTNRVSYAYAKDGYEPLAAFATLVIDPWMLNAVDFSVVYEKQAPAVTNLVLGVGLADGTDYAWSMVEEGQTNAVLTLVGKGNYGGTLVTRFRTPWADLIDQLRGRGTVTVEDGRILVRLTADVPEGLRIPKNLEKVVLDLNGHLLGGDAGKVGLTVEEGSDTEVVDGTIAKDGKVRAGSGVKGAYALSTNGVVTVVDYALSGLNSDGETNTVYNGRGQSVALTVSAADGESVKYPDGNSVTNAGTHRIRFTLAKTGHSTVTGFVKMNVAPWEFNPNEFSGVAIDNQPWSSQPYCPEPMISNLTIRVQLTALVDFTYAWSSDTVAGTYVLASGRGNYTGTLKCPVVKQDVPDIGKLYQGDVPIVVTGYTGEADGKAHAVTYRWTSINILDNTVMFSLDGKNWSAQPPSFTTTHGHEVRVYYYAHSRLSSSPTWSYDSERWYVTVLIYDPPTSQGQSETDGPSAVAPAPQIVTTAGRPFTDNGDGTVGVTIGNAKAGVTYQVTAARSLTFAGAKKAEATATADGPLTINVQFEGGESGFFKTEVVQP